MKEESFSNNLMAISGGAPLKFDDKISFATAFAHARKVFGEEGLFMHRGKIYSTKGGDMAPEPSASMEESVYAQKNAGTEGMQSTEQNSGTAGKGTHDTLTNAESGQPAKPQPKLKKKPEIPETNEVS